MGRISPYHKRINPKLSELQSLADSGATDRQIAALFGISLSTHYEYIKLHPEYSEAVMRAKDKANSIVESALFKAAVGGFIDEVTETQAKDTRDKAQIRRSTTKKYIPPNPSAALNWLKNRCPDEWRDSQGIELTKPITIKLGPEEDA